MLPTGLGTPPPRLEPPLSSVSTSGPWKREQKVNGGEGGTLGGAAIAAPRGVNSSFFGLLVEAHTRALSLEWVCEFLLFESSRPFQAQCKV